MIFQDILEKFTLCQKKMEVEPCHLVDVFLSYVKDVPNTLIRNSVYLQTFLDTFAQKV
jgi:hypothetical protein